MCCIELIGYRTISASCIKMNFYHDVPAANLYVYVCIYIYMTYAWPRRSLSQYINCDSDKLNLWFHNDQFGSYITRIGIIYYNTEYNRIF